MACTRARAKRGSFKESPSTSAHAGAWRSARVAVQRRITARRALWRRHLIDLNGAAFESARIGSAVQAAPVLPKGGVPRLLLAHKIKPGDDVTGWWMSEKLDGVR